MISTVPDKFCDFYFIFNKSLIIQVNMYTVSILIIFLLYLYRMVFSEPLKYELFV